MDFNTATLRQELFTVLRELRSGQVTPQHAMAAAKLVHSMVASARLDIDASRFIADSRRQEGNVIPLKLGQAA